MVPLIRTAYLIDYVQRVEFESGLSLRPLEHHHLVLNDKTCETKDPDTGTEPTGHQIVDTTRPAINVETRLTADSLAAPFSMRRWRTADSQSLTIPIRLLCHQDCKASGD